MAEEAEKKPDGHGHEKPVAPVAGEHEKGHGTPAEGHGEAHAEARGGGGGDPMHHILDAVLYGVDAKTGEVKFKPYDEHGHAVAGYAPKMVGPFKLEFTKHMGSLTVAAMIIFVVSLLVSKKVLAGLKVDRAPQGKLTNAVESVIVFIRDELVEPTGGHHLGHYTPIFISYFFLILVSNFLGLVPDVFGLWGSATGNFGITAALALSVYAFIWILGMINQGPIHFLLHLVPPGTPLWLWPLMFILELISPIIKCFVLSVRLFANMIAGHLIIANLLSLGSISGLLLLLGVPLALGISVLEILVCVLQAYVFTLLAVGFIGAAVHPEH